MDVLQPPRNDAPARMEPLATLPVFWSLEGKKVIVAGGSDAAAWKAELMAACGAEVHVYADDLSECFAQLIGAPAADLPLSLALSPRAGRGDKVTVSPATLPATLKEIGDQTGGVSDGNRETPSPRLRGEETNRGRYFHHPRPWYPEILDGAALAIADCEDEDEACAFFQAARVAGVPVNVIDKPAYCQFQFGSIVNRSPVVVAISTDGAAPILAQAIRRRIETLLPRSLKSWAALARSMRDRVNGRLAPGPQRRAFWERFVDRAFATTDTPEEGVGGALLADAERLAEAPATGRVTLVGAGPGDAELMTLKAVRALQSADVILFDDLVSDEVLELARREARRMLVGKRGGRESCRQEDINDMMVTLARAGKHVVRLKSGDATIFGRAGEEIERLEREGIPVEIVAGITAASAMASRLGVSLTHRDCAQSVRFITGHSRHGGLPTDVDWRAVADPRTTTVFYMGGRTACLIAGRLAEEGLPPATPAVIVSNVSRPSEKRWLGTVESIPAGIATIGFDDPVLIGVGAVFEARAVRCQTAPRSAPAKLQKAAALHARP
ncbi:uroporphyrinogen-III C-methyltransferase [Rhizobium subbaraonis]|uniref:Uroporphyrinogen-III C-methyltransferase n=1 Tax=Rhizobium subbaraonis TaxID=908946 RepID=A0A285UWY7_9HYPH|nr:siroheme synthase CysG [Rhizobium subbaraonis]SOC45236.1 uroporphyrinogen-III C-methyltransferase [Rhizobium subbaraonis]